MGHGAATLGVGRHARISRVMDMPMSGNLRSPNGKVAECGTRAVPRVASSIRANATVSLEHQQCDGVLLESKHSTTPVPVVVGSNVTAVEAPRKVSVASLRPGAMRNKHGRLPTTMKKFGVSHGGELPLLSGREWNGVKAQTDRKISSRQFSHNKVIASSVARTASEALGVVDAARDRAAEIKQDAEELYADAKITLDNARATSKCDVKTINLVREHAAVNDRNYVLPEMPKSKGKLDMEGLDAVAGWFEMSDNPWFVATRGFIARWSQFDELEFFRVSNDVHLSLTVGVDGVASVMLHAIPHFNVEPLPGDARPVDHLVTPYARKNPRLTVVSVTRAGKKWRDIIVSATLFREMFPRFAKVDDPINLSQAVTMGTRFMGINTPNETVIDASGNVIDLTLVVYNTAVYMVNYHLRAVVCDRLFWQPEPAFSPLVWLGGQITSSVGLSQKSETSALTSQRQQVQPTRDWSLMAIAPLRFVLTPFSWLSQALESRLFLLFLLLGVLSLVCLWAAMFVVPRLLPQIFGMWIMQYLVPLNVLAVLSRLHLLGFFVRFGISLVCGYAKMLFLSPMMIFQDLMNGWSIRITIKNVKKSCAQLSQKLLFSLTEIYDASLSSSWNTISRVSGNIRDALTRELMRPRPILAHLSTQLSKPYFGCRGLLNLSRSVSAPATYTSDASLMAPNTSQRITHPLKRTLSLKLQKLLNGNSTTTWPAIRMLEVENYPSYPGPWWEQIDAHSQGVPLPSQGSACPVTCGLP